MLFYEDNTEKTSHKMNKSLCDLVASHSQDKDNCQVLWHNSKFYYIEYKLNTDRSLTDACYKLERRKYTRLHKKLLLVFVNINSSMSLLSIFMIVMNACTKYDQ